MGSCLFGKQEPWITDRLNYLWHIINTSLFLDVRQWESPPHHMIKLWREKLWSSTFKYKTSCMITSKSLQLTITWAYPNLATLAQSVIRNLHSYKCQVIKMCNSTDWFMNINGIWQLSTKKQTSCALHLSAGTVKVSSRESEFAKNSELSSEILLTNSYWQCTLHIFCFWLMYFSYSCG